MTVDRATALSPAEMLRLDMWAEAAFRSFDAPPMLVGSAVTSRTFRDVDVRLILLDDDPLLAQPDRLRFINVAASVWAQETTGLPVDFQIQSQAESNEHDGPVNPLGMRWRRTTT